MSLVIRFSPPSLRAEQYDEVVRRLNEAGVFPADGLDYELCFGSEGNLKVSQVWDSQEQLQAFGERLRPILADVGIDPGEPEVLEVHNIIKREGRASGARKPDHADRDSVVGVRGGAKVYPRSNPVLHRASLARGS